MELKLDYWFLFIGKTPKGVKKKPRRRHKKGKGSPGGVGPKKGPGSTTTTSARTITENGMLILTKVYVMEIYKNNYKILVLI